MIESKAPGVDVRSISMFYYEDNFESSNAYVCLGSDEEASISSIIFNGMMVDDYKINALPLA